MQRKTHDHIEWLEFDLLADFPRLHHAVFLRKGGCSQPPFDSLNIAKLEGENEKDVEENLLRIQKQLKFQRFVMGRCCHQDRIAFVDETSPSEIKDYDGLMSRAPGISLMMNHADCQIGLFYDPKNHAIANIHAGWRGSVKNIFGKTVTQMQKQFGSNPADLLVCISPSLGPENAEFINYAIELPQEFWQFQVKPLYFDFWSISECQLQNAGILTHHIEIARLCTYANPSDYFSYRRDKVTGRHATCITLT